MKRKADSNPEKTKASVESKSIKSFYELCINHASDLLDGAKNLNTNNLHHLGYHLAVASLEEIGKAELGRLGSSGKRDEESDLLQKWGEDHVKKIFWALWSGTFGKDLICKEQIERYTGIANLIHSKRMQGLYVSTNIPTSMNPKDLVSEEDANNLLKLVELTLGEKRNFELASLTDEEKENVDWFLQASADPLKKELIFGLPSQKKLMEIKKPREWVSWLRKQFEDAEKEAITLAQQEINRRPEKDNKAPKWRLKVRLHTDSHKIRPKILNWWNTNVDFIKLLPSPKNESQLIIEFIIPEQVTVHAVYWVGWAMSRRFSLALNIGTLGFWWWNTPLHRDKYYENLYDIKSKAKIVVAPEKKLSVNWRGGYLSEANLRDVAICNIMIPTDIEKHEPFNSYLTGLGFLGVLDVNLRFEANCYESFFKSIQKGMELYGECEAADFKSSFRSFVEDIAPDLETDQFERYFRLGIQFEEQKISSLEMPDLSDVAVIKIWCDAFFLKIFRKKFEERFQKKERSGELHDNTL